MKTSRFLATRLATVALLAVLASTALAQDQGGPPPGGPGGFGGRGQGGPGGGRMGRPQAPDRLPPLAQLALRPEVAAELALTDEQRAALDEAIQAMREAMRPPQPGGDNDGPPDFKAMQAAREKAEADTDAKVRSTLSAAQVKRLGEIQVQSMGLAAALVPSVQTQLGLSDAQKAKLKALVPARGPGGPGGGGPGGPGMGGPGGGGPDGQGGPPPDRQGGDQGGPPPDRQGGGPGGFGGPGGPGGPGGGGAARRKAMEAKIAAILTSDQKATLKALGGKPIQLAQPDDRGGRGGRRGPGGGGDMNTPPPMR